MATKPSVKWVKAANAWCMTTYEFDKKKNTIVNRVTWHEQEPRVPVGDDE
jgi:hypothetical protein